MPHATFKLQIIKLLASLTHPLKTIEGQSMSHLDSSQPKPRQCLTWHQAPQQVQAAPKAVTSKPAAP
jgi:hypothetical protein